MLAHNTAPPSMSKTQPSAISAEASKAAFAKALAARGFGPITTEILERPDFYYAEAYHQQYLAQNPRGYCGLGGTGVILSHRHRAAIAAWRSPGNPERSSCTRESLRAARHGSNRIFILCRHYLALK